MKTILKSIVMGIALGATLFFLPAFIFGMLLLGLFFKLFFRRRMHGQFRTHRLAFAEKIRSMNENEFTQFKTNFTSGNFNHCRHQKNNCNN